MLGVGIPDARVAVQVGDHLRRVAGGERKVAGGVGKPQAGAAARIAVDHDECRAAAEMLQDQACYAVEWFIP
ncbi:hypothetical protein D3C84_1051990 [compost metagenome]